MQRQRTGLNIALIWQIERLFKGYQILQSDGPGLRVELRNWETYPREGDKKLLSDNNGSDHLGDYNPQSVDDIVWMFVNDATAT